MAGAGRPVACAPLSSSATPTHWPERKCVSPTYMTVPRQLYASTITRSPFFSPVAAVAAAAVLPAAAIAVQSLLRRGSARRWVDDERSGGKGARAATYTHHRSEASVGQ